MIQIEKEEWMHVAHGEHWVKRLGQDEKTRADVQRALEFWFPKVNKVFGKAGTETNKIFQKYKLKQRDNNEVRQAWYDEIKPLLEGYGLKMPGIEIIED